MHNYHHYYTIRSHTAPALPNLLFYTNKHYMHVFTMHNYHYYYTIRSHNAPALPNLLFYMNKDYLHVFTMHNYHYYYTIRSHNAPALPNLLFNYSVVLYIFLLSAEIFQGTLPRTSTDLVTSWDIPRSNTLYSNYSLV
jgi:hypothetical protein